MKQRNSWLGKLFTLSLCVAMAAEPMAVYAEEIGDTTEVAEAFDDFDESAVTQTADGDEAFTIETENPDENTDEADVAEEITAENDEEAEIAVAEETDTEETDFSSGDAGSSEDILSGKCGANVTWELKDGILTIAGSGEMDNFEKTTGDITETVMPWNAYKAQIKEIDIKDGVTRITKSAFTGHYNLEKAVIGNSVTTIEDYAFSGDYGLKEVTIGNSVKKIGKYVFYDCGFTEITLPDSVTELGEAAFRYCRELQKFIFGKGLKIIPLFCFQDDWCLTSVTIPEGVTTIEEYAFENCYELKKITIPSTITEIKNKFGSDVQVTVLNKNMKRLEDGSFIDGIYVSLTAQEMYKNAFEVLRLLNKERAKVGAPALVMDQELLDIAMQRAFETVIYYSHERPNGTMAGTISDKLRGENIAAGYMSSEDVMDGWMGSNGHRWNILRTDTKSVGIGCVYVPGGSWFWVQCFGTESAEHIANEKDYNDKNDTRSILVKKSPAYYSAYLVVQQEPLIVGQTATVRFGVMEHVVNNTDIVFESSNPSVCEVNNGKLTAKKPGTVYITAYHSEYKEGAVTEKVTVEAKPSGSNSNKNNITTAGSTFKVSYYLNGGQGSTIKKNIKKNAKLGTLPKAKRNGYTFAGWYTAKTKGTKVSANTKVTKNLNLYAHWTKVKVAKGSVKKLTNSKGRKAVVSLKKISGAKGYQIVYANNAKFKGAKGITTSKTSVTLKSLKKNKTYYVKVRAYKLDSAGKKVFGSYSQVKKIKIKK